MRAHAANTRYRCQFQQPWKINGTFVPSCRSPLIDCSQTLEMFEFIAHKTPLHSDSSRSRQTAVRFLFHYTHYRLPAFPWTLWPCQSNHSNLDPMPIQQTYDSNTIQPAFTSEFLFHEWAVNYPSEALPSLESSPSSSERFLVFIDQFWRDEYTLLKWLVVVIWTSCNNSLQVLASKHYPASPLLRAST